MLLTAEEKEMLEGKHGKGNQTAMKIQVAIGESFHAGRMVPISRAHVALSNQEADLWFVEKLLDAGAYCRISPTVNPGFDLEYFKKITTIKKEDEDTMGRTGKAYREIGATLTFDCTPYLGSNIPRFGEIVAFSESSATPYINSVWGARSNRESAQSALCAAITGRVPEYGFLLDGNRAGDILVEVQADLSGDHRYQLLGMAAKKIGNGVPVFLGIPRDVSPEGLMNLGAQLNTVGAYSMFHIVGVTPEAPTLEKAFYAKKPKKKVVITDHDLAELEKSLISYKGPIDFALLGCPMLTISQVGDIAKLLKGRKLKVTMYILTNSLTKELAKKMGYLNLINDSGGHLLKDTCMDQPPFWRDMQGKFGVTESPKCAYYSKRRDINYAVMDIPSCVEAAIQGEIK